MLKTMDISCVQLVNELQTFCIIRIVDAKISLCFFLTVWIVTSKLQHYHAALTIINHSTWIHSFNTRIAISHSNLVRLRDRCFDQGEDQSPGGLD